MHTRTVGACHWKTWTVWIRTWANSRILMWPISPDRSSCAHLKYKASKYLLSKRGSNSHPRTHLSSLEWTSPSKTITQCPISAPYASQPNTSTPTKRFNWNSSSRMSNWIRMRTNCTKKACSRSRKRSNMLMKSKTKFLMYTSGPSKTTLALTQATTKNLSLKERSSWWASCSHLTRVNKWELAALATSRSTIHLRDRRPSFSRLRKEAMPCWESSNSSSIQMVKDDSNQTVLSLAPILNPTPKY